MGFDNASINMFNEVQKQGLKDDEVEFTDIVETAGTDNKIMIEPKMMTEGSVSYVPRKPRYFNSVKQGFEWNKYN